MIFEFDFLVDFSFFLPGFLSFFVGGWVVGTMREMGCRGGG
jgi:hypothetical protein